MIIFNIYTKLKSLYKARHILYMYVFRLKIQNKYKKKYISHEKKKKKLKIVNR